MFRVVLLVRRRVEIRCALLYGWVRSVGEIEMDLADVSRFHEA